MWLTNELCSNCWHQNFSKIEHMHQYSYIYSTWTGEDVSPVLPEAQFIEHVRQGKVKPKAKVCSPTRTNNQWVEARTIPLVAQLFNEMSERAAREKELSKAKAAEDKQQRRREAAERKEQKQAEQARQEFQRTNLQQIVSDSEAVCPFCKNTIKMGAKKCQHCGEYLDKTMRQEHSRKWSPGTAAAISILLPGVGHLYKGQTASGLFLFLLGIPFISLCYFSVVGAPIGLIAHIMVVLDAARKR